jgi:hypothetical protein
MARGAVGFVLGLLSGRPAKKCWTISAQASDDSPDGMQHLLREAVWDGEKVSSARPVLDETRHGSRAAQGRR